MLPNRFSRKPDRRSSRDEAPAGTAGTSPPSREPGSGSPRGVLGRPLLGPTLVEAGVITQEQLDLALERQQQRRIRLGAVLCELGFCRAEDVARGLALQNGMPFVSLQKPPPPSCMLRVRADLARELGIVPVGRDALGRLIVVAKDPLDIRLDSKLRAALGVPVVIAWGIAEEIDGILADYEHLSRMRWDAEAEEDDSPAAQIRRTLSQIRKC